MHADGSIRTRSAILYKFTYYKPSKCSFSFVGKEETYYWRIHPAVLLHPLHLLADDVAELCTEGALIREEEDGGALPPVELAIKRFEGVLLCVLQAAGQLGEVGHWI